MDLKTIFPTNKHADNKNVFLNNYFALENRDKKNYKTIISDKGKKHVDFLIQKVKNIEDEEKRKKHNIKLKKKECQYKTSIPNGKEAVPNHKYFPEKKENVKSTTHLQQVTTNRENSWYYNSKHISNIQSRSKSNNNPNPFLNNKFEEKIDFNRYLESKKENFNKISTNIHLEEYRIIYSK